MKTTKDEKPGIEINLKYPNSEYQQRQNRKECDGILCDNKFDHFRNFINSVSTQHLAVYADDEIIITRIPHTHTNQLHMRATLPNMC